MGKRSFHQQGFTLIEILVVMVIIGLLAGVALPRLYDVSRRYEWAAQKQNLLIDIGNLGYRAYQAGQAIRLDSQASIGVPTVPSVANPDVSPGGGDAGAPVLNLPDGWQIEVSPSIRYSFNGVCSGGQVTLVGPGDYRERFVLIPPLCHPVSEAIAP